MSQQPNIFTHFHSLVAGYLSTLLLVTYKTNVYTYFSWMNTILLTEEKLKVYINSTYPNRQTSNFRGKTNKQKIKTAETGMFSFTLSMCFDILSIPEKKDT